MNSKDSKVKEETFCLYYCFEWDELNANKDGFEVKEGVPQRFGLYFEETGRI